VVVLLSLPLGWFALKMRQAERQRKAVEAIREVGGWVGYDYQRTEDGVVETWREPPAPAWLRELIGDDFFSEATGVYAYGTNAGDVVLEHLKGLPRLEWLSISGRQITDARLKHLKGLTGLDWLVLSGTEVRDGGLVHLRGLTELKYLNLTATHVTEEGIEELRKALPNCKIIWEEEIAPTTTPKTNLDQN